MVMFRPLISMSPWSFSVDRGLTRLELQGLVVGGRQLDLVLAHEELGVPSARIDADVAVGRCRAVLELIMWPMRVLITSAGDLVAARRTSSMRRRVSCLHKPPARRPAQVALLEADEHLVVDLGHEQQPAAGPAPSVDDARPRALDIVAEGGELHLHPAGLLGVVDVGDDADREPECAHGLALPTRPPSRSTIDDGSRPPTVNRVSSGRPRRARARRW